VQHVEYGNAEAAETAIKNLIATGESVAAMILEPIQGEAGIIVSPKGYLKAIREICDKYGVFLIFDEIQTGMCRTGYLWVCEAEGVVPDVLVFGKAFGGGVMPITGIIARPHLWNEERFYEEREDIGWKISREDYEKMLDEYYALRKWSSDGKPGKEIILELGLGRFTE